MKYSLTLILLLAFKVTFAFDVIDDIAGYFKAGNVKEIAKYFSSTVELSILEEENIYSAGQSELILKDFFAKHPPSSVKVIHKVTSNPNFKFGVIVFNSTKGNFRISFELKSSNGSNTISQIRIEENKE